MHSSMPASYREGNTISFFFLLLLLQLFIAKSLAFGPSVQGKLSNFRQIFRHSTKSYEVETECYQNVNIDWQAELNSKITNTPIIGHLFNDGKKQIILTKPNMVEVLDAEVGRRLPGWPFSFSSVTIASSPLLYDIDGDGYDEIVVSTKSGEIVFLTRWGEVVHNFTLKLPKLEIKKLWRANMTNQILDSHYLDLTAGTLIEYTRGQLKKNAEESAKISQKKKDLNIQNPLNKDVWKHFEGHITEDGIKSLQWFLDFGPLNEEKEQEVLHSPQYFAWLEAHPEYHQNPENSNIFVDAHITSTPVIADINDDGNMDIVVVVNYYFDEGTSAYPKIDGLLDVDLRNCSASGVVVFDLKKMQILWQSPIELSKKSLFDASITFSPTVIDLDEDGKLETVVGTGLGSIYVLDSNGNLKRLLKTGLFNIECGVLAEDLNNDGKIDFLVMDTDGNVMCLEPNGNEIWRRKLMSASKYPPVLGDLNGDGELDVAIVSKMGYVWICHAKTGYTLNGFPQKLDSTIFTAPILLPLSSKFSRLSAWKQKDGLSIVVHGLNGCTYIINGKSGCIYSIDLGEPSSSMVLADTLTQYKNINILIATSHGRVHCLTIDQSNADSNIRWTSQLNGRNSFTVSSRQGIRVSKKTRSKSKVSGNTFEISFEIIDERQYRGPNASYMVRLWLGSELLTLKRYTTPGTYTEHLQPPKHPISASLKLEMVNEHGQAFFDDWFISFNVNFYETLKWVLVIPFLMMSLSIVFTKEKIDVLI